MASPGIIKCYYKRFESVKVFALNYGYTEQSDTLLSVFYTIIGMIAITGNLMALYFFYKIDKRFTASKIFYSTFAAIDLVIGVVCCWCGFIFAKSRPLVFCSFVYDFKFFSNLFGILETFTMMASTNVIALMSISRCVGVLFPFRYRYMFSPKRCYLMIGIVCIHPAVVSFLPYFFAGVEYTFQPLSGQHVYLYSQITNETDTGNTKSNAHLMKIFLNFLPRILSFGTIVVCSIVVAMSLVRQVIEKKLLTSTTDDNKPGQMNASITLVILAALYLFTYAPFCIFLIADVSNKNDFLSFNTYWIWVPCVYLVAYGHSALNPFVYHLRGKSIFESKRKVRSGTVMTNVNINTRMSVITDTNIA